MHPISSHSNRTPLALSAFKLTVSTQNGPPTTTPIPSSLNPGVPLAVATNASGFEVSTESLLGSHFPGPTSGSSEAITGDDRTRRTCFAKSSSELSGNLWRWSVSDHSKTRVVRS